MSTDRTIRVFIKLKILESCKRLHDDNFKKVLARLGSAMIIHRYYPSVCNESIVRQNFSPM